ncbi:glycosyltransferase family 4 protein [Vibrio fluvialis]|nr:glycosyltransferase family 4 protein [Vibrio fluvialis]ELL4669402.1 glycosyltransferase family 4 protein [Vibrio fluvialis]
MKVSIIGPFPEPIHGMSKSNETLLQYFEKSNDVTISYFDITLERRLKSKNRQGKFRLSSFFLSLVNLFKLLFFVFQRRGDVMYITPPQSVLGYVRIYPAILFAKILGSKIVIHIHGSRFSYYVEQSRSFFQMLVKSSFRFIDAFILLGESIKLSHSHLLERSKIFICENGVEDPHFTLRSRNNTVTNVLFLSNLMKDKGIFDFLDAIEKIHPRDQYHFALAGAIEPSQSKLIGERLSRLGPNVSYHGVVTGREKEILFEKADIFILPSYDEGQPLSILEAYSYGCTVVTTCIGGIPDIFEDGINGKYVEIGSPDSIVEKILELKKNEIKNFSHNNIKVFEDKYTKEKFCKRVLDILNVIKS